jgi:nicotinamide riboside kinase
MAQQRHVYIIGAQCTGKTTLVEDVARQLQEREPGLSFTTIQELARGILQITNVNRDDIKAGSSKAMNFQRLVLEAQFEEELDRQTRGFIISDRSGIDPIAYTKLYGSSKAVEMLLGSSEWAVLRQRMQQGVVILCEPVREWLFDDGIRLMPGDHEEWYALHRVFIELLQEAEIAFTVLPAQRTSKEERIGFVLDWWKSSS